MSDCGGYFTSIIRHFADFPQMSDYGGYSIIRQFANPTFFSSPIECRIMEVPLYHEIDNIEVQKAKSYLF